MEATWTEIILAAPIGFAVGFVLGLAAANRFIIAPRDRYRVVERDHSNERGT